MRQALRFHTHIHHGRARQADGLGVGGVQHEHGGRAGWAKALFAHFAQQVAHGHGHIAKVDVHRAGRQAFVAHGAVVGHVFKLLPVFDADAAAGLLLVQKGLYQQRGGQDLVARAVQQVGARHMGSADRLALAAAQAVFHAVGNGADVALLHDQGLMPHQAEAGRVGIGQIGL